LRTLFFLLFSTSQKTETNERFHIRRHPFGQEQLSDTNHYFLFERNGQVVPIPFYPRIILGFIFLGFIFIAAISMIIFGNELNSTLAAAQGYRGGIQFPTGLVALIYIIMGALYLLPV